MSTGAAAYSQLKGPDNGISQSMQYWGGLLSNETQREADRAETKRQFNQLAKERADEKSLKNLRDQQATFEFDKTGYKDLPENLRSVSKEVEDVYGSIYSEYAKAEKAGDIQKMAALEQKMKTVRDRFKATKDMMTGMQKTLEVYEKLEAEGKLSGGDLEQYHTIKSLSSGDAKTAYLAFDRNTYDFNLVHELFDPVKGKQQTKMDISALLNGRYVPIENVELIGEKGLVKKYEGLMGTYEQQYYDKRARTEETRKGFNEFAEENLKKNIFDTLSDTQVMGLAYQFNQIKRSELDGNPVAMGNARDMVSTRLAQMVMGTEDITEESKRNFTQDQIDASKQKTQSKPKVTPEQEKIVQQGMAVREIAEEAAKGNVNGLLGLSFDDPNRKGGERRVLAAYDHGNKIKVKLSDGSYEDLPKEVPAIISYVGRSRHLEKGSMAKVVQAALESKNRTYNLDQTDISGGFSRIREGIEYSKGETKDDKAAKKLAPFLDEGWTVKNSSNWFGDDLDIYDQNGNFVVKFDRFDPQSVKNALGAIAKVKMTTKSDGNRNSNTPSISEKDLRELEKLGAVIPK